MEYELSYWYRIGEHPDGGAMGSSSMSIRAKTTLGLTRQLEIELERGFPVSFPGKLIDMTPAQITELTFREDLQVGFKGKRYKFAQLNMDGTFELCADGWSRPAAP
jgi:hypothetical protein